MDTVVMPCVERRAFCRLIGLGGMSFCLLAFVGCLPERLDGKRDETLTPFEFNIDTTSYDTTRKTTPRHVAESIGSCIEIDAEVVMPGIVLPAVYNAEAPFFCDISDKAVSYLRPGDKYKKERSEDNATAWWTYEDLEQIDYVFSEPGKYGFFDSYTATCDYVSFWQKGFMEKYGAVGIDDGMADVALSAPYKQDGVLMGFSSEKALSQARKLLKLLGISAGDIAQETVYAMPARTMEMLKNSYASKMISSYEEMEDYDTGVYDKEISLLKSALKREYTTADEMYSVHIQLAANGVPIEASTYGQRYNMQDTGYEYCDGCYVHMYVGRENIQYVKVYEVLKAGSVFDDGFESVLPLDSAMNALLEKYGSLASASLSKIDRIALEYCPMPNAKSSYGKVLIPAWVFRNADDPDYALRVHALTGDII